MLQRFALPAARLQPLGTRAASFYHKRVHTDPLELTADYYKSGYTSRARAPCCEQLPLVGR
jgi:hypothetical protein